MGRLDIILLFCILGLSWITADALRSDRDETHSTRRPGEAGYGDAGDTVEDGDENDSYTEDEDEEAEEPLLVTSVEHKPFLMVRDGEDQLVHGKFEGIIPDLLDAICLSLSCEYEIETAVDGKWGTRNQQGHWTGMIGEVAEEEVDFAAAAISITAERLTAVNFSVPFAANSLTVLVNRADEIDNLETLLSKNITIGGISGAYSLNTLRNQPMPPYSTLWAAIESDSDSKVGSIDEGVKRLLEGGYAFVCEAPTARYLVEKHCSLDRVEEEFLPGKGYGFAFPKHNDGLEKRVNMAILSLNEEGKIEEIFDRWMDVTCGAPGVGSLKVALLVAIAAVIVVL